MQNQSMLDHGNQKKKIIISAIAVVLLCSLAVGMLAAKYLNERNSDGLLRAQEFYFTSNLLDNIDKHKKHALAPGSTSFTFTVGNHGDDLRYAEMDINYTVTVKEEDGKPADGVTVEQPAGKLVSGSVQDTEVTISNLKQGKTYTIEAVGTGGYTKKLTATIKVPAIAPELCYHLDNSAGDYTLLTVWNEGDAEGSATITYTGIPDNTNPNMTKWKTGESQEVTIGPHESKVFRFFNTETITVKDKKTDKKLEQKDLS